MKNLLKTTLTIATFATATTANAWWGPFDHQRYNNNQYNGYNTGNGFSNFMNDMTGDMDFSFDVKIKGRGFGNIFNNWNGYNNLSSYNGYYPYGYNPYTYVPATKAIKQ